MFSDTIFLSSSTQILLSMQVILSALFFRWALNVSTHIRDELLLCKRVESTCIHLNTDYVFAPIQSVLYVCLCKCLFLIVGENTCLSVWICYLSTTFNIWIWIFLFVCLLCVCICHIVFIMQVDAAFAVWQYIYRSFLVFWSVFVWCPYLSECMSL